MRYPIRIVAREAGLTPHVLRAWEKRYGAVTPHRTPTGRRMYSEPDVHRLKLLRSATSLGHSIGSLAGLPIEVLERVVQSSVASETPVRPDAPERPRTIDSQRIVQKCVDVVRAFDADALNKLLRDAALDAGYNALLHRIVAPLARRIGQLWGNGQLRVSHEHFATAVIRGFLLNPARQYSASASAPMLVATTPQGELHELGALMAAACAAEQGWRAIYLGPSLPAAEIAGTAIQQNARLVALSLVYPQADPLVEKELRELRQFLPGTIRILLGGRAAPTYPSAIRMPGVEIVRDFRIFENVLARISRTTTPALAG